MKDSLNNKGFSIVEILIAAAIISSIGLMVVMSINLYIRMSERNSNNMRAALLFEETAEVLVFLRDESWANNINSLSLETEYYLRWNGSNYYISSTQFIDNGFERTFSLSEINRDSNDSIAESGSIDPETYLVDINIRWTEKGKPQNLNTQMLIHNVYDN